MKSLLAAAAFVALGATLVSAPVSARSMMSSKAMPTCAAGDTVVWVNTRSKVFYEPGASYYGKTRHGKYVCESQATSMGMHMAKGGMMSDSNGSMMGGHSGMMKHGMMKHHGMMHGGAMGSGSMRSGSMGSGSMGSGSMGSGSMGSGSRTMMSPAPSGGSNSSGSGIGSQGSGSTPGPGNLVTPAPTVSASPSN